MSGLFSDLRVGLKSLSNMEAAMSVVSENIANVNTPGYSRKRIIFEAGPAQIYSFGSIGQGADIARIESVRDSFIENRIRFEMQMKGLLEGQEFGLSQIETILAGSAGSGIPDNLSRFFNSFLELASDPSSIPLRQSVLSEAEKLAFSIQDTFRRLDSLDVDNRHQITDSVASINSILGELAQLNAELAPLQASGVDGGGLKDRQQELLNQLSQEIDIQTYTNESGSLVITNSTGRLLLVGDQPRQLQVKETTHGQQILLQSQDISSEIKAGRLGGFLDLQRAVIPSYKDALNTLASELVQQVNAIHQGGEGLDGITGRDFFSVVSGQEARTIAVALSNGEELAAGPTGSAEGDGSIAQQIADLRNQSFPGLGGGTLDDYYSQLVFEAGLDSRYVKGSSELQSQVLTELQNQRDSVSGVSLDEEAVNLIQFQRSYQASAQFIRVVDSLLEETINLIR